MRTSLCIFILIFPFVLIAQSSSLSGRVAVFNSQFETGIRQYIANAQVEEDYGKSQATTTTADGSFHLPLVGLKDQESVFYSVKKTGYEVVNTDALQAVAGQADTQWVFMAQEGKIAENKLKYYRINRAAAEKALTKRLQDLEIKIATAQTDKTPLKQLREEYSRLQAQFDKIEEMARNLAERYAKTNLDDVTIDYQRAFRCFERGQLDSTILILDASLLDSNYQHILDEGKRIDTLKEEYKVRSTKLLESKRVAIETLHFKGNLHYINFDIPRTEQCYELLLQLDSMNTDILSDFGFILSELLKLDQAIQLFLRLKALDLTPERYIKVNLSLARLYLKKKDFSRSQSYCQHIDAFNKTNFAKKTVAYRNNEAQNITIMGDVYLGKNDLNRSWKMYLVSIDIYEDLYRENKGGRYVYENILTLQKAGMVLQMQKKFARSAFTQALELINACAHQSEYKGKEIRLGIDYGFARIALFDRNLQAADSLFNIVLQGQRSLARENSSALVSEVAEVLNSQCELKQLSGDFAQAETLILAAIDLWKGLNKERLYIDRHGLISSLQTAKGLYLNWIQHGNPKAGEQLKRLYRMFPRFQKRIIKGSKRALMTNALQADGSLHIPHDHRTQFEYWLELNTGHAYLLKGKSIKALEIYLDLKKIRGQGGNNAKTYAQLCLDDFDAFEKIGITLPDIPKIRKQLQQK